MNLRILNSPTSYQYNIVRNRTAVKGKLFVWLRMILFLYQHIWNCININVSNLHASGEKSPDIFIDWQIQNEFSAHLLFTFVEKQQNKIDDFAEN